jgi:hypothetical protein
VTTLERDGFESNRFAISAKLAISCPGRSADTLPWYTAAPRHKIAKTTPCKVLASFSVASGDLMAR